MRGGDGVKIGGYDTHPAAGLFPLIDDAALDRLAADIKTNGLRVPVILLDDRILDGRNRMRACIKAGVTPRFVTYKGSDYDPWRAVWSLNAERRQIEDKLRLALIGVQMIEGSDSWKEKQQAAREKTRAGKAAGGKKGGRGRSIGPASQEAAPIRPEKASARMAAEIGVSRATVERAAELESKRPDEAARVRAGGVEGHKAYAEIKRAGRVKKLAEAARGNEPLPVGRTARRYPVIYADPPWRYEHVETENRAIENHYPTMDLDAICALPVASMVTDDAILFLWATSPKLAEAMRVIEAWGFTYRTCAVWVKDKIGMGYYYRQRHELLLVATRGHVPVPAPANRPDSVIEAPLGKHSAKPLLAAEQIERMYPELPRIELFCRSSRPGWAVWGNQS